MDLPNLKSWATSSVLTGMWVIYEPQEQQAYVDSVLECLIERLLNLVMRFDNIEAITPALDWMPKYFALAALAIKDKGFHEESEYRLVKFLVTDLERQFRIHHEALVPYIEVGPGNMRLPMTSITVGPGVNSPHHIQTMCHFLQLYGLNTNEPTEPGYLTVNGSTIPYRS